MNEKFDFLFHVASPRLPRMLCVALLVFFFSLVVVLLCEDFLLLLLAKGTLANSSVVWNVHLTGAE